MMEAASTSEMSVNFYQTTRRNNPEDSHRDNIFVETLHSFNCKRMLNYNTRTAK
jgi:hypothetical protein